MVVNLLAERGELTNKELELVAIKLNLSKTMNNGEAYNFYGMRECINRETILELYAINIGND